MIKKLEKVKEYKSKVTFDIRRHSLKLRILMFLILFYKHERKLLCIIILYYAAEECIYLDKD